MMAKSTDAMHVNKFMAVLKENRYITVIFIPASVLVYQSSISIFDKFPTPRTTHFVKLVIHLLSFILWGQPFCVKNPSHRKGYFVKSPRQECWQEGWGAFLFFYVHTALRKIK